MSALPDNFNRDLFASHTLPFAAYAEPEGYSRLTGLQAPQIRHYEEAIPTTVSAARGLLATVIQRDEWGQQYVDRLPDGTEGGEWRTETIAHTYRTGGRHERRGKQLDLRTVLRSLARTGLESGRGGNEIFALGRTDRHLQELETGLWKNEDFRTTPVAVLLLDIDMDDAWERKDIAPIRRELAIEREIATNLRLPYRTFRTGNRGHQIVLPLPAAIDRSAAWWLLYAYVELLSPYHFQSGGLAKADRHNLSGLVRIAGGRHATTKRVAFWIDPADGSLFPIHEQIEQTRTGYQHPTVHPLESDAFSEAASEIAVFIERQYHIAPHLYPQGRVVPALAFASVMKHLPDNLLVERFLAAQELLSLSDEDDQWENMDVEGGLKALEAALALAEVRDERGTPEYPRLASADEGSYAWAERVWAEDWPSAGIFWDWISEGGKRGITAAKVLFGEEQAEQELLSHVDTHAISRIMPGKARERKRVIRAFYSNHHMTGYGAARRLASVVLPDTAAALVPDILRSLNATKPIQTRNFADLERLVSVLLLAFAADATTGRRGFVDLSLDDLASVIRARWPETKVNRDQVGRYIKRLVDSEAKCGFALLTRIDSGKGWTPSARYCAGPDLRASSWGQSLPFTECKTKATPRRSEAIILRVSGGIEIFQPPQKRGRKPHRSAEDADSPVDGEKAPIE